MQRPFDHPRRVTDQSVWREYRDWLSGPAGGELGPNQVETYVRTAQRAATDSLPRFSSLWLDSAGRVWVGLYQMGCEAATAYVVLGRQGEVIGTVEVPNPFRVLDISSDRVLGVN